ncbi:alpha/beta hydrolase [Nisaea denitrificans]|uniref:alpha/beta hydrolase n=1 Tax=Nisaea denitrificans TaxID=390877 RepID=UPI000412328E|nr:alpha/beta fold hydrolase [Nisaea denitrificans]
MSRTILAAMLLTSACIGSVPMALAQGAGEHGPLTIREQGSFTAGGTISTEPGSFDPRKPFEPAGQTYRGDHLYTFYQIPVSPRKYPIVMWHGYGQFSKTWETTADGREGFQNIFLRRKFPVYLIDQPRRGNAGRSMAGTTLTPKPDEQFWFGQFRVGVWPNYFDGVQFPRDAESLDQYFRAMTPDTGPLDVNLMSDTVSDLFGKIGPGILFTHSHSGGMGWSAAMKSADIKAIVAFEPGSGFTFPESEVPDPLPSSFDTLKGVPVAMSDFLKLTKIPIIIFYGDNIPGTPTDIPTQDAWRVRLEMARIWSETVNKHGGDVTLVHLPDIGITGNTHFPFSDLNNVEIADLVSKFLTEKDLD